MSALLTRILDLLGKDLSGLLTKAIDTAKVVFSYLDHRLVYKEKKQLEKEQKTESKEIKDICDKGSLSDLLDKFMKTSAVVLVVFLVGCTTAPDLQVTTTRQWEGHYFSEKEFHKATDQMSLQKGESVWVMSNKTLNKILTSQRNDKR